MKYEYEIMRLMFRCEYITDILHKNPLTKTGKGWFNARFWCKYNDIMCAISKKHENTVLKILNPLYKRSKITKN